MRTVLIRHTSVDVPKGTCYGWTDVPVADTFQEEATETLRRLQPLKPFDAVFSSPLTRARKLAAFCGYGNAVTDDRLKEMNMGDWEMKPFDLIKDPELQQWYDDYMHVSTKNGESFPAMYRRVSCFLDELKDRDYNNVAIFAHGGVLICAGIYGGLFSADDAFSHLVPYGGMETIEI